VQSASIQQIKSPRLILILSLFFLSLSFLKIQGQEEPSRKSQLIYKSLKAFNSKEKIFRKLTSNPVRNNKKLSPNKISRKLQVVDRKINGFRMLTVSPEKDVTQHIVLLHGGAYVAEANKGHRVLMEKLALEHGFKVTFIAYPLAPEHGASETIEIVMKAYLELIKLNQGDAFYLLGDSAGGGLALALLQLLRDKNIDIRPDKTVLLSPWLDISMQNPEIDQYIDKEVVLSLDGLKTCGKQYAGGLDLHNPIVSPIAGDLNDLHNFKVYVSSHELFYPDCLLLKEKIELANGSSIDLSIRYKMVHDWVLFPIPERDETIKEIVHFFSGTTIE
jgi:acetyl esterase/lipase